MTSIKDKKISRKKFLKTCGALAASFLIGMGFFNFLKEDKKTSGGYGTGGYGN